MSIPDTLIKEYLDLITDFSKKEKVDLYNDMTVDPMAVKMKIAFNITAQFHSKDDAEKAQTYFINTFSKKTLPEHIQEVQGAGIDLITFLIEHKLSSSKSEARRLVEQCGIKINGEVALDTAHILAKGDIFQKGKLTFLKII